MGRSTKHKILSGWGVDDLNYAKFKTKQIIDDQGNKKRVIIWTCDAFDTWSSMVHRVYGKSVRPTYKECSISEEWRKFSDFKVWFDIQTYTKGYELDKDILFKGSKIYSAKTCVLVPQYLNTLLINTLASLAIYPIGVCYKRNKDQSPPKKGFVAVVRKFSKGKHLGYFTTPMEAHKAWQLAKADQIHEVVNVYTSSTPSFRTDVAEALLSRAWGLRLDAHKNIETTCL